MQGRNLALVHLVASVGSGRLHVFQAAHKCVDCGSFLGDAQRPRILLGAVANQSRLGFPGHGNILYRDGMLPLRVEFALSRENFISGISGVLCRTHLRVA